MNIKSRKKICCISCWFGPFPWYLPYFIHSCSFNPTIDFIIITGNKEVINDISSNVKIVQKELDEIKLNAAEKLGFKVNIDYAYKLCDFKPAFGFLFPELIEGYDFWGHSDIDVIFGDVRNFMTEEILDSYDVISSRHDYITGSFCLYRNTEQMNRLFMESKDYKKVFSNSEHFCFDECNFLFSELQNGACIFDYVENVQSMTYVVKNAERNGMLKAFFDFIIIEGTPGRIEWNNGKIIYKGIFECMFYHLIKFKTTCKKPIMLNPIPNTFYFTPTRIITKR